MARITDPAHTRIITLLHVVLWLECSLYILSLCYALCPLLTCLSCCCFWLAPTLGRGALSVDCSSPVPLSPSAFSTLRNAALHACSPRVAVCGLRMKVTNPLLALRRGTDAADFCSHYIPHHSGSWWTEYIYLDGGWWKLFG